MKVEITETGANGPQGPHQVGEIVDLGEGQIPSYLVGKCRAIGTERTAVTNPAEGAVQQTVEPVQSAQERQQLLGEAAKVIEAESFLNDGRPDVRAINDLLDQGVKHFDAAERDQLWPGVADAVKAARESG